MALGIITGSGTYALPGFEGTGPQPVETEWGDAFVSRGTFAGADVFHIARHEEGHVRLSNHVTHQANLAALEQLGAAGVLAVTVCGAVDPGVELGSLICFDDLHFLANRLPDGRLCTFHQEAGHPDRGHWIFEDPYSPPPASRRCRRPRGRRRRWRARPSCRSRSWATPPTTPTACSRSRRRSSGCSS